MYTKATTKATIVVSAIVITPHHNGLRNALVTDCI